MKLIRNIRRKAFAYGMAMVMFVAPAGAQDVTVSIKGSNITIRQALESLEAQSRYTVAYDATGFDVSKKVSLDIANASVMAALEEITRGQGVAYRTSGNHIFITPAPPAPETAATVSAPLRPSTPDCPIEAAAEAAVVEAVLVEADAVSPAVHVQIPELAGEPVASVVIPQTQVITVEEGITEGYGYRAPRIALKTNLLYDATTTINLGAEFLLGRKLTLDVPLSYNPWTFSDNKKIKHFLVQPELRYWTCEPFNHSFFGVHLHYAYFNMGGFKQLGMENFRYQGNLYGAGISYGYHWILAPRWSLEGTIGVGYARLIYDKYECETCGDFVGSETKDYFGPTKAGVSLVFMIK